MTYRGIKGVVQIVVGGLATAAGAILIALQWGNHAEFSFFGCNYSIRILEKGQTSGGVNTAALMLASAVGGVTMAAAVWLLARGILGVRRERAAKSDHGK